MRVIVAVLSTLASASALVRVASAGPAEIVAVIEDTTGVSTDLTQLYCGPQDTLEFGLKFGEVSVPTRLIRDVVRVPDKDNFRLTWEDGETVLGSISGPLKQWQLTGKSELGSFSIDISNVKSIRFRHPVGPAPAYSPPPGVRARVKWLDGTERALDGLLCSYWFNGYDHSWQPPKQERRMRLTNVVSLEATPGVVFQISLNHVLRVRTVGSPAAVGRTVEVDYQLPDESRRTLRGDVVPDPVEDDPGFARFTGLDAHGAWSFDPASVSEVLLEPQMVSYANDGKNGDYSAYGGRRGNAHIWILKRPPAGMEGAEVTLTDGSKQRILSFQLERADYEGWPDSKGFMVRRGVAEQGVDWSLVRRIDFTEAPSSNRLVWRSAKLTLASGSVVNVDVDPSFWISGWVPDGPRIVVHSTRLSSFARLVLPPSPAPGPQGETSPGSPSGMAPRPARAGDDSFPAPEGWPKFSGELNGSLKVLVKNPNATAVRVGLRSAGKGRDFVVRETSEGFALVPAGTYELYIQYASDPGGLYRGDDFTLSTAGVEIRLIMVVNGNYGLRKVR